jgi:hypothetical protein
MIQLASRLPSENPDQLGQLELQRVVDGSDY